MKASREVSRFFFALVVSSLLAACNGLQIDDRESAGPMPVYEGGFDFPIAPEHVRYIKGLKAYGIAPWGGEAVHNGVDIIVDHEVEEIDEIRVVSPAGGVVLAKQIVENPNANLNLVLLVIGVSEDTGPTPQIQPATAPQILVALAFEPQTKDRAMFLQQWWRITVEEGDVVNQGGTLGYLQVDHQVLASEHYVHIDYRILINPQRMGIEELIEQQDEIGHDCWTGVPTYVCPLIYSSSDARGEFQKIIARNSDPQFFSSSVCEADSPICIMPVDSVKMTGGGDWLH